MVTNSDSTIFTGRNVGCRQSATKWLRIWNSVKQYKKVQNSAMQCKKCQKGKRTSKITNIGNNCQKSIVLIYSFVFYWVLLFYELSFYNLPLALTAYNYCWHCPFSHLRMVPSKLDKLHCNRNHLLKSCPVLIFSR